MFSNCLAIDIKLIDIISVITMKLFYSVVVFGYPIVINDKFVNASSRLRV